MPSYIAFLRAINLGAQRKFPKDDLAACVRRTGARDVATYINTGNVRLILDLPTREQVEDVLEQAFAADRGFEVLTIAYTPAELVEIARTADEVGAGHDGAQYVTFLKTEPTAEVARLVEGGVRRDARAFVRGRAVHVLVPEASVPGLGAAAERALGVGTSRTLTVLRTLAERWGSDDVG